MNARTETVAAEEYALEISRVFDAPPSVVFKALTKPEHMARWWGPKNFTTTVEKLEFREGGSLPLHHPRPNDHHHGMSGVFREIVEPKRIVFTFAWDDEKGEPGNETLITDDDQSRGREDPADVPAGRRSTTSRARDSHAEGWGEVLDKLVPFLDELRG